MKCKNNEKVFTEITFPIKQTKNFSTIKTMQPERNWMHSPKKKYLWNRLDYNANTLLSAAFAIEQQPPAGSFASAAQQTQQIEQ